MCLDLWRLLHLKIVSKLRKWFYYHGTRTYSNFLFQCFQPALLRNQARAEAHHIVCESSPETPLSFQESYLRGPWSTAIITHFYVPKLWMWVVEGTFSATVAHLSICFVIRAHVIFSSIAFSTSSFKTQILTCSASDTKSPGSALLACAVYFSPEHQVHGLPPTGTHHGQPAHCLGWQWEAASSGQWTVVRNYRIIFKNMLVRPYTYLGIYMFVQIHICMQ